jgi:hypothetical protein
MRCKQFTAASAVIVGLVLTTYFWWPALAQSRNMAGFKRYPPEDYFVGQPLALAHAIREGDLALVKQLAPKTDLDTTGNKKATLLSFAVQEMVPVKGDPSNVHYRIISELVKDGAKPEQPFGKNNDNVAYIAARADTPNLLKALLEGGMSPDLRYDGDTPLIFATGQNNLLPQLHTLVEHGANVNIRDSIGNTPLFDATRLRQWDVVDYLLDHGADPTAADDDGLRYAKVLHNQLMRTPKESPQTQRIEAIGRRVITAGGRWPPV